MLFVSWMKYFSAIIWYVVDVNGEIVILLQEFLFC
jgi:hypothetical protein